MNVCVDLGIEPTSLADKPGLHPYLVMKLICYHPQPAIDACRPGVAAHVDSSWITLTLEDDTGGLEIRVPDGPWIAVEPEPGTLMVHVGEILAFATRGRFCATPHRVINRLTTRSRVSIPIFLNPSLQTVVTPILDASPAGGRANASTIHTSIAFCHRQNRVVHSCSVRQSGAGRDLMYGALSMLVKSEFL